VVLVFSTLPRSLRAAIIGVPAAGVALAAVAAVMGGFAVAGPWRLLLVPGCFVAIVVAERYPVKIGLEQKISLGALPCLVAALLLPPGIGPATAALGVLAGVLLSRGIAETLSWPLLLSPTAVLAAVTASVATGIAFGYYPARRASRKDPIEALRYE